MCFSKSKAIADLDLEVLDALFVSEKMELEPWAIYLLKQSWRGVPVYCLCLISGICFLEGKCSIQDKCQKPPQTLNKGAKEWICRRWPRDEFFCLPISLPFGLCMRLESGVPSLEVYSEVMHGKLVLEVLGMPRWPGGRWVRQCPACADSS